MELVKSYIVDGVGAIQSVVIDYQHFKKVEEMLLDLGLAKAMEESQLDEEFDLEEAKTIANM